MTPGIDKTLKPSPGTSLEVEDWNIMFCAVLARLGAAIGLAEQSSAKRDCVSECLASLDLLRQSALQSWRHPDHHSAQLPLGEAVATELEDSMSVGTVLVERS